MKHPFLIAAAALTAASLACSFNLNLPRLPTGPTETVSVSEPLPENVEVVKVEIDMAAGQLDLSGGADGLVEGEIRYNVPDWKPAITNTGESLVIRQGDSTDTTIGIPDKNVVNEWTLRLGGFPMELALNAGAYEGTVNLSGVPLRRLQVRDGASKANVVFDSVNPEEMSELRYDTGASTVSLVGLANANAAEIVFNGGAGNYALDFTGELQRDLTVTIKAGVSAMRIVVPDGTAAKVSVSGGLNDVKSSGTWTQNGDNYEISGSGPTITIKVDMGVGSLELVNP